MKRFLPFLLSGMCGSLLWGQHRVLPAPQIGIGLQSIVYQGDLSPADSGIRTLTPGFSLSLSFPGKHFTPTLSASFGSVQGQQVAENALEKPPPGVIPNQFVETRFTAIQARLHWNLLTGGRFIPYLCPGAGVMIYDPHDPLGNSLSANPKSRLGTETYSGLAASLSAAAGFSYKLSPQHSLSAEVAFLPLSTDYLDNVGQLGKVRGNDRLLMAQIGLQIGLGQDKVRRLEQRAGEDSLLAVRVLPMPARADTIRTQGMPIAEMNLEAFPEAVDRAIREYDFIYYPVKRNDQIDTLAARFQVPVAAIEQLNFIRAGDALTKDMILRLPNTAWGDGESPMDEATLQQALDNKRFIYYRVRKGETLPLLAVKSGVPVSVIRQLNFLFTGEIEAGDLLRMPDIRAK